MASLILACGCHVRFVDGDTPSCPDHGQQRVVRTVRMPKPTIRGAATGPLVQTMDLGAYIGKKIEIEAKT